MPASFITHQGKQILYLDYSGLTKKEDMMATLEEGMELFHQATGKVRALINMTDAAGNSEWMEASKRNSKMVEHKVLKSAIIGVTGIKKVLLMGYNSVAKGRVKPFSTKEDALEYLAKD